MPILSGVTTKAARSVWKSPDGQREIFEVGLEFEGEILKAKTYSKDISQDGWTGDVETYEKEGRAGTETFVKQPPKEGGFTPRQAASPQSSTGGSGSKPAFDQYTMYLSYAKDLLVALQSTSGYDVDGFNQLLAEAVRGGKYLFDNRPGAEPKQEKLDIVVEPDDAPINLDEIDKIFGDKETSWQPKS